MSATPESHNLEELLAGYVLGNLDEEELVWLHQQLEENPQLKDRVHQLQETLALMPYGLPSQTPSPQLRNRIVANARLSFPKTLPDFRGARSNRMGWIFGAIAVFATFILGIENVRLRQQLAQIQFNPNREIISLLRQPNNRLMTLKGLDEVSTASGSLFIVPQRNKAVLVLQNLTPLNGTDVYQLWAVSQNKKTGCISFVPNQNGMVYVELSQENLKNANSVLVTIEPKPDVSQPTGTPVVESIQSL